MPYTHKLLTIFPKQYFLFFILFFKFDIQAQTPVFYNDYPIISNLDSLEKAVEAQRGNPLAYMHGLITLESNLGRLHYPYRKAENLEMIKTIAEQQGSQLGKVMYNCLTFQKTLAVSTYNATVLCQESYQYFEQNKDTIGMMVCKERLARIILGSDEKFVGRMTDYRNKLNEYFALANKCTNPLAKIMSNNLILIVEPILYEAEKDKQQYIKSGHLEVEKAAFREGLRLIEQNPKYSYFWVSYHANMGNTYYKLGDYTKAVECGLVVKEYFKSKTNIEKFENALNLGAYYEKMGKNKIAEKYCLEALAYSKEYNVGNNGYLGEIYNRLLEINLASKKYKLAFNYLKLRDSVQSILHEENRSKSLFEAQLKYDTEKKELVNIALSKDKEQLKKQNNILIVVFLFTAVLLLVIIMISIKLRKSRAQAEKAFQQIQVDSKFREQLFSMIAHDIRSPIIAYNSLAELINYLIKNKKWEDINKISARLDTISVNLTVLLDNLLEWTLKTAYKVEQKHSSITVDKMVLSHLSLYMEIAQLRNISFDIYIQDNLKVFTDENALRLIVRNLLDNAIKNSETGQIIKFRVEKEEDFVVLTVANKPKKNNPEITQKIQALFSETTSNVEIRKNGLGLGLIMINDFAKSNDIPIKLFQDEEGWLSFKAYFIEEK